MTGLTGKLLINGSWVASSSEQGTFAAINPANNTELPTAFSNAAPEDVDLAVNAATEAFTSYSALPAQDRATFLEAIANAMENSADGIVERGMLETGLPEARLRGELGRTTGQLRLFANLLKRGDWKHAVIDTANPERQPLPKPDIRLTQIPLGPVVVFAASNFPLAFSTAGGDTASALAAGCPVIVKAHSAHPGTSELVADCILAAIKETGVPTGTFALIHGPGRTLGKALVQHPGIKAGGFTGSVAGGRALFDVASQRPDPIPFFGELGSTNPVFLLQEALAAKGEAIAQAFVGAMTLGAGQFCTNPGILVARSNETTEAFIKRATELVAEQLPQTMLTPTICASYREGNARRESDLGVSVLAKSVEADGNGAAPVLMAVSASDYLANPHLQEEIFGPSTLMILCETDEEMLQIAKSFHGHLTSSLFAEEADSEMSTALASVMQNKVGRLIFNGYGTGVEVCAGMSHGGPYPSSTNVQSTSVGERAIDRFVRPLCYQNTPDALLPDELKNANPLGIPRLVNGNWTTDAI
ncbi:aldehyde dehydrogenase (NADP(+)) [Roseibium sp. SCP14]|uniref:aldehyde dehydrogenase (NADP(+)) n=1 Tax=Roseibium sp. SCP14 TaxID=3141375 RepID=UPI003334D30F